MGDYYRSDGRSGNRRPPKRRYRSDEEEGDYRGERRYRPAPDPLAKLRRETLSLAESPLQKIGDAVKHIAKDLSENFESEEFRNGYFETLQALVVEQPFKIPFLATIVLVANQENAEVGKVAVETFSAALQRYLDAGSFTQAKLVLRLLACVNSMLDGKGVYDIFQALKERAVSATEEGHEGLALVLTYIILISLPYSMAAPGGQEMEAYELLKTLEEFVKMKHPKQDFQDPFGGNTPPYRESRTKGMHMTEVLWLNIEFNITGEPEDDFSSIRCLPEPWKEFTLSDVSKHALPELVVPTRFPIDHSAVSPEMYFSVFADQPIETVPVSMDLASTLFRDAIVDTINILDCNRLTVSRFLIDIDCFFNPHSFVKRATPYDRVVDAAAEGSTWKPEDIVVDAVFSQLFKLPQPEHKLVYYHSILTELCKLAPAAIAPSLGRAIRFMYRNLEILDTELIYRFVDWFSHHLSNFGYTWKWTEWTEHLNFPDVHPKKAFILGSLEKEIRLSFATRIKGTLPEAFKELIPEEREKEQPVFKFDLEETPLAAEGKELMHTVADRKEDSEIEEIIAKIATAAEEQGLNPPGDPRGVARDAYITAICHIGAKSLSHVLSCIERCKDKLLSIGKEHPDARRQIVASVLAYWHDQPGIGANVVDKLLNYSIVTPQSVVDWVLYHAGTHALSQVHAWEMVATTIGKVNNRVHQIRAARSAVEVEGVTEEQRQVYENTLRGAEIEQVALLQMVTGALQAMEGVGEEAEEIGDVESRAWIQWWAKGWLRAFRRKFGVRDGEETIVREEPQNGVEMQGVEQEKPVAQEDGEEQAASTNGVGEKAEEPKAEVEGSAMQDDVPDAAGAADAPTDASVDAPASAADAVDAAAAEPPAEPAKEEDGAMDTAA